MEKKVVHPVDEVLPKKQLFVYGLQHVLAMYSGAVVIPLIIANVLGLSSDQLILLINADLFVCGIATIIQSLGIWKFGIRLPIIQGITFTVLQPVVAIGLGILGTGGRPQDALVTIFISVIIAGIFTMVISPLSGHLLRLFPPVVTGTLITAVGISLIPVGLTMIAGQGVANALGGDEAYGTPSFILIAFIVILIILLFNKFFTGFVRNVSVIIGIIVGYLICLAFGMVDLSIMDGRDWFGLNIPFYYFFDHGAQTAGAIQWQHLPVAIITMIIVMFTVIIDSTGTFLATADIVGKKITKKEFCRGIAADGLSSVIGGSFNSLPYTAFAENLGLIALTGVKSRWVVVTAGGILVLLGSMPKLAAFVESIPVFVIGGAAFVMFATVAGNGIRILKQVDFDNNHGNILIISISLGMAVLPMAGNLIVPSPSLGVAQEVVYRPFFGLLSSGANSMVDLSPILSSGIFLAAITAVILNLLFNGVSKKDAYITWDDEEKKQEKLKLKR